MAQSATPKPGMWLALAGLAVLAAAGGWMLATLGGGNATAPAKNPEAGLAASQAPPAAAAPVSPLAHLIGKDPVAHYREGRTAKERMDAISNILALGDDNCYQMLKAALDDPDKEIRVYATESAHNLEIGQTVDVWKKSAISPDPDVREMTWSLCAPYPIESRAAIYREALLNGPAVAMSEALNEMSTTPERSLFEMMLTLNEKLPPDRASRLVATLQEWLEPGGGEVPRFNSIAQVIAFWEKQHENYDEYLLRVDQ